MPSVAPLYLESDTYTSTLYLVNRLTVGIQADVNIYDMSGAMLTTKHLYLEANTQQTASIKKILSEGSFFSEAGSVEVVTPTHSAAVLGQLSITRTGSNPGYLDEEFIMPEKGSSQTLRSVIDSPENSPIVAITNISGTVSQTLHTSCIQTTGGTIEKTLSLQPKETKLVRACSTIADTVFSADALDAQFVLKPESASGSSGQHVAGINITTDGPPGELAAFGFVAHVDKFGSYFSAMNFYDPKLLNSTGFVFTGVPVGASTLLPSTSYVPQVALANFSSSPQTVTVMFAASSEQGGVHQVASIAIPAGNSQLIALPPIAGDPGWQNSFVVRSTGEPGDVIAKMMFKNVGQLPNIELIGKDENDVHTAGDHPWNIDGGARSILFLFNHSPQVRSITVRVGTANAIWLKIYDLQPNENKAISIGEVVSSGTLDMSGRALPKSATSGEVGWWAPAKGFSNVTGRVVQIDSSGRMARNFSCGEVIELCDISFLDQFIDLGIYNPLVEDSAAVYCTVDPGVIDSCPKGYEPTYYSSELTYDYSSTDTSIATVGNSGEYSNWNAMAIGSTFGSITSCDQTGSCCDGNSPVDVSQLSCTVVTRGQSTTCTASGPSGATYSNWRFTDGTNTVTSANGSTTTTWSGIAVTSGTVSVTVTNSDSSTATVSAVLTVNARSGWAFPAVPAVQQTNPYSTTNCSISVPSTPADTENIGDSCIVLHSGFTDTTVTGGPNSGYSFFLSATQTPSQSYPTSFNWIAAQDVLNTGSAFYQNQCGNYNPTTNTGFISGSNLQANTIRHESALVQGHYGNYVNFQSASQNNVGIAYETAVVYGSQASLESSAFSVITQLIQNTITATAVEPFPVNESATGVFLGNVNFPPNYTPCN